VINGPGTQTRDYVYVGDVVASVMAALEAQGSDVLNVGTGVESDVNVLYRHINTLTGAGAPEVHGEAKPGEQQRSVLDATRIRERLGWIPSVTLEEGLGKTVESFRAARAVR
jgi:UDP-glucose 4-epimerase